MLGHLGGAEQTEESLHDPGQNLRHGLHSICADESEHDRRRRENHRQRNHCGHRHCDGAEQGKQQQQSHHQGGEERNHQNQSGKRHQQFRKARHLHGLLSTTREQGEHRKKLTPSFPRPHGYCFLNC